MEKGETVQVLIVDDHQMFTDGLKFLVDSSSQFRVCGIASSEDRAYRVLDSQKVDMVLMDIRLPGTDGIELTRRIKSKRPDIKVIIISTFGNEGFIQHAIEAGADGYLLKDDGKEKLLAALETVWSGHTFFSQEITDRFVRHIQKPQEKSLVLSSREIEVLEYLSKGFTSEEIGDKLAMSKHTVDVFRRNLMHKFDTKNVVELIRVALQEGYIL